MKHFLLVMIDFISIIEFCQEHGSGAFIALILISLAWIAFHPED